MESFRTISVIISAALLSGCASVTPSGGPKGPELVSSSRTSASGSHYAEVGVEFSTWGDFTALVSPNRWKSPIATGGSLSWLNPAAWSEDAGRTGRILLGEAVVVGGVAAAASGSSGGGSSSGTSGGNIDPPPPPGPPIVPSSN